MLLGLWQLHIVSSVYLVIHTTDGFVLTLIDRRRFCGINKCNLYAIPIGCFLIFFFLQRMLNLQVFIFFFCILWHNIITVYTIHLVPFWYQRRPLELITTPILPTHLELALSSLHRPNCLEIIRFTFNRHVFNGDITVTACTVHHFEGIFGTKITGDYHVGSL